MSVYVRRFPVQFDIGDFDEQGDGRTVIGRIVPYGETISFVDPYDGGTVKRERFVPGAFNKQLSPGAWSQVILSFQHQDGFENSIGYGRQLQDHDDGAWATFRLYEADAAKAREMMLNSHRGLSVEFEPRNKRDRLDDQGVILRDNVHVRRVGITNDPAYTGAQVLAVRERDAQANDHSGQSPREPTPHLDAVRAMLAEWRRNAL